MSLEAIKALVVVAIVAGIFGSGWYEGFSFERGQFAAYRLAQERALEAAKDKARAEQSALDAGALDAANREVARQASRVTKLVYSLKAARHVPVRTISRDCVPYGFVRVLDASAGGVSPDALALPAGKSLADCAPVGWRDLAAVIVGNYGTARDNAGQLNALIAAWRAQERIHKERK